MYFFQAAAGTQRLFGAEVVLVPLVAVEAQLLLCGLVGGVRHRPLRAHLRALLHRHLA
jgi:hypothetical protein